MSYKNLFSKDNLEERIKIRNRLDPIVQEIFNEKRVAGFHPREIYLVLLDSINEIAITNRRLAQYDRDER